MEKRAGMCPFADDNDNVNERNAVEVLDETISVLKRCLHSTNNKYYAEKSIERINEIKESQKETGQNNTRKKCDETREVESSMGQCTVEEGRYAQNGSLMEESGNQTMIATDVKMNCIEIVEYENEHQMADIMRLITKVLSEPYSIYTYRYFIHNWPKLCLLALDLNEGKYVGAIVCKLDMSRRENRRRGYIAMLAVDESCRKRGIGTRLVQKAISNMQEMGCDQVVLETEVTNTDALRLYSNLGFIREKRLFRYYLNGVDAYRLKLFLTTINESLLLDSPMFCSNDEC